MKQRSNIGNYSTRNEIENLLAETIQYKQANPFVRRRMASHEITRTPSQKLLHIASTSIYFIFVLVLCIILFVGIRAKLRNEVPMIFGYRFFTVETGSMVPTLSIGCYIIVKDCQDPTTISQNAIVTFYFSDGTIVTHRIIEVLQTDDGIRYRTKGDNPENDPDAELLSPDRVIGTVQFVIRFPEIW